MADKTESVVCKGCGTAVDICSCLHANFLALAQQGELTRKLAQENEMLKNRVADLEATVSTARVAVKWVVNHWGRTAPELSGHDKRHAEAALKVLEGVRKS